MARQTGLDLRMFASKLVEHALHAPELFSQLGARAGQFRESVLGLCELDFALTEPFRGRRESACRPRRGGDRLGPGT